MSKGKKNKAKNAKPAANTPMQPKKGAKKKK